MDKRICKEEAKKKYSTVTRLSSTQLTWWGIIDSCRISGLSLSMSLSCHVMSFVVDITPEEVKMIPYRRLQRSLMIFSIFSISGSGDMLKTLDKSHQWIVVEEGFFCCLFGHTQVGKDAEKKNYGRLVNPSFWFQWSELKAPFTFFQFPISIQVNFQKRKYNFSEFFQDNHDTAANFNLSP